MITLQLAGVSREFYSLGSYYSVDNGTTKRREEKERDITS